MPSIEITEDMVGPYLKGDAPQILDQLSEDILDALGQAGIEKVHRILDSSIRHPTPYYETQIVIDKTIPTLLIHDRGIIYGPWLEGVGSRNGRSRFKGYSAFRTAKKEVENQAGAIIERTVERAIGELNG